MATICSHAVGARKWRSDALGSTGVDMVGPLDLSADIDFTDPTGLTHGFCPRALYVGGTAGNLAVEPYGTITKRTVPAAAGARVDCMIAGIYSTAHGSTATNVFAVL